MFNYNKVIAKLISLFFLYCITSNSQTVSISTDADSISENGGGTDIYITLNEPIVSDVIVNLTFSGYDSYYTKGSNILTITAGEISASTNMEAIDNNDFNDNKTVSVSISSVQNATASSDNSLTVTIVNNDILPKVRLSAIPPQILENSTNVVQWNYFSGTNQQWKIKSTITGEYYITNNISNLSLEASDIGLNSRAVVLQNEFDKGTNQLWQIQNINESDSEEKPYLEAIIVITSDTLQESDTCLLDGTVDTNHVGFTDSGFSNTDNYLGAGIEYKINSSGGAATMDIQYASLIEDRPADIYINGNYDTTISLPPSGSWDIWTSVSFQVNLDKGVNDIRIEASTDFGLPNVDYVSIEGYDVDKLACTVATHTLSTTVTGSGSINLTNGVFVSGEYVTIIASPDSNHYTANWSGTEWSNGDTAIISMDGDKSVSVEFIEGANIPDGTYTITSKHTNYKISINDNDTLNGANIIQTSSADSTQQHWILTNTSDSTFSIINSYNNKSLETGSSYLSAKIDHVIAFDVVLNFSISGSANNGSDFYAEASSITIPAGETENTFSLTPLDDILVEGNELIDINVTSISNGEIIGSSYQSVTILDDDNAPKVFLNFLYDSLNEENSESYLDVQLSRPLTKDTIIYFTYSGTAQFGSDYTLSADSVIIYKGETRGRIKVIILDDNIYENNETIIINEQSIFSEFASDSAIIIENEMLPEVTLSLSKSLINESNDSLYLIANIDKLSAFETVVIPTFSGIALGDSVDYFISNDSIVISIGTTTDSILIRSIDDNIYEINENFTIEIDGVVNGTQQVNATIIDDDNQPLVNLVFDNTSMYENQDTISLTASLNNISGLDVIVKIELKGSAIGDSVDYYIQADSIIIYAGELSGSISIYSVNDSIYEANENIIANIASVTNAEEDKKQMVMATIQDDDTEPSVLLNTLPLQINEDNDSLYIIASLSHLSNFDVITRLSYSGTALFNSDYYTSADSIVINAGSYNGRILLTTLDDNIYEENEDITIDILSILNGVEDGVQQQQTIISDDDSIPNLTLYFSTDTVKENEGTASVFAEISNPSYQDVTLMLNYSGTAVKNSDFTSSSDTIIIEAGDTVGFNNITAIDDVTFEGNETLIITTKFIINATEDGTQTDTVIIAENESTPTVALSIENDTIAENGGISAIRATLNHLSTKDILVKFVFTGTAQGSGMDYITTSESVIIESGSKSEEISLISVDDIIIEGDESVIVEITESTNAMLSDLSTDTIWIEDDDSEPFVTLNASPDSISEFGGIATISATISHKASKNVIINLTLNGSASEMTDYVSSSKSITIKAGDLSSSTSIIAQEDLLIEGFETIEISIENIENAYEEIKQLDTIIITDNDELPRINISTSPLIILEGIDSSSITATLNNISAYDAIIYFSFSGSANQSDYNVSSSNILIPEGETTGEIIISSIEDIDIEGSEYIIIVIDSIKNGVLNNFNGDSITIQDNDSEPLVSLEVVPNELQEDGEMATITAHLNHITNVDVTIQLNYSGTATGAGVDYTEASSTIIIPSGSFEASTSIQTIEDIEVEGYETILISILNATNAIEDGEQKDSVIIIDNDSEAEVSLIITPASISEDGVTAQIVAKLNHKAANEVIVNLSFQGSAENQGIDYTVDSTAIKIQPGLTTGSIFINIIDDNIIENDENIIVNISSVIGAIEFTEQTDTLIILDNDNNPSVSLKATPDIIPENNGIGTITATLSHEVNLNTLVYLSYQGTATGNGTDFVSTSNYILIEAGKLNGKINLITINDSYIENNETIIARIDSVSIGKIEIPQDTIIIQDDDQLPLLTLSVSPDTINENNGISTISAILNHSSTNDIKVYLSFKGTAQGNSNDYLALSKTIIIKAGNTISNTAIVCVDDIITEGSETIIVRIDSVDNAGIDALYENTIIILDNDGPPEVTLSASLSTISENNESCLVTASINHPSIFDILIHFEFGGSAIDKNVDYFTSSNSITIPAGELSGNFTINTIDDLMVEGTENIIISIDTLFNAVEKEQQIKEVNITDNDKEPVVSFKVSNQNIDENAGSSLIIANIDHTSPLDIEIFFSFSGSATGKGIDYITTSQNIKIIPGSISDTIQITAINDSSIEGNEIVTIKADSISNATFNAEFQTNILILDDDFAPVNLAPLAINDSFTIKFDEQLNENVLLNDTDPNGDLFFIDTYFTSTPDHGEVVFKENGDLRYTPQYNFIGTEQFSYKICDKGSPSLCDSAFVVISIITNDFDQDGITDDLEGNDDPDEDGIPSYLDTDSDNDSLSDIFEGTDDPDNDGIPNYKDFDSDNDLINDKDERKGDCDFDGIPNVYDPDECSEKLTVPQLFTPNNDGNNDRFEIYNLNEYNKVSIEIFNRWGKIVYRNTNYKNDWEGTNNIDNFSDAELPVGTYFYVLTIEDTNEKYSGFVYLNK